MNIFKGIYRVVSAINEGYSDKQKTLNDYNRQAATRITEKRIISTLKRTLTETIIAMEKQGVNGAEIQVAPEALPYMTEVTRTLDAQIVELTSQGVGVYMITIKEEAEIV